MEFGQFGDLYHMYYLCDWLFMKENIKIRGNEL